MEPGLSLPRGSLAHRLQGVYRHSELRKVRQWLKNRTLHWSLFLLLSSLILGGLLYVHDYLHCHLYAVRVDGIEVGLVRDPAEIEQFMADLTCKCSSFYQVDLYAEQEVTLTREYRPEEADNFQRIRRILMQRLSFLTEAVMLTVDGAPLVPVPARAEVDRIAEKVCQAFVSTGDQVELLEVELKEEIAGQRCTVSPEQVYSTEEIIALLTRQSPDREVLLASREPLPSRMGREQVDERALPAVHVRTVEKITVEETVPFATRALSTDELYLGESRVVTAGKRGLQEATYRVVRENGVEQSREALSHRIITEPEDKVVERGTRRRFAWPVAGGGSITQRFHAGHRGVDIAAAMNTSILAAESGVVVVSGWGSSQGNYVVIRHSGYYTVYLHNNANLVSVGQKVSRGQTIARLGSTGNSTGPHLHFEIRRSVGSCWGSWNTHPAINPLQFF